MRALVTGANGLIGANVVRAGLAAGYQVRGLVRAGADTSTIDGLPVERCVGDVRDLAVVREAAAGCDLIFHTAVPFAYGRQVDADVAGIAEQGTANVLHAAKAGGVTRVVVTSSSVIFGYRTSPVVIDETHGPASGMGQPAYVAAKLAQDAAALQLADDLGVEVVLPCPTMTLGPHAVRLGPSNAVVVQYLADPLRTTYAGGIDVVSVEDVAEGHVLVAEFGRPGEHYLLGGDTLRWSEVHATVAELAGVDPPRWTATHVGAYLAATGEEVAARIGGRVPLATREQAAMIGRYYWYSHRRAAALGYAPSGGRETLARAIAWLAASRHVSREMRTTLRLHPDVYAARHAMQRREQLLGVPA